VEFREEVPHGAFHLFASLFAIALAELRSPPAQCQKRFVVLGAQSFGCGVCTASQPWSTTMSITRLEAQTQCHFAASYFANCCDLMQKPKT